MLMDVSHSSLEGILVLLVFLVFLSLLLCIVHSLHVALYYLLLDFYIRIFHILLVLFLFVLVIMVLIHPLFHTILLSKFRLVVFYRCIKWFCGSFVLIFFQCFFTYPSTNNTTCSILQFQSRSIPMYLDHHTVQSIFTGQFTLIELIEWSA